MSRLKFFTSGESHGKALTGILEGIPANLALSSPDIDAELKRRQSGFGRGGRMKIESDHAEILSGVRWGRTIGSPLALLIENRDHKNWVEGMSEDARFRGSIPAVTKPRPGHADLAGAIKYHQHDIRNILERSSARETAMRVALGAVAKKFLSDFGIKVGSYVIQIGKVQSSKFKVQSSEKELFEIFEKAETSPVRCPDTDASRGMVELIEGAMKEGNSLGGVFEVFVTGAPVGLGSHIQWDRKLDGRLAQALMSIQAIKAVEIGLGFEMSGRSGSEVMDEIFYRGESPSPGFYRKTNNAGGIEGGMTNGMPIIIRAGMKPIPTLRRPLNSVDIISKEPFGAAYERSDVCAAPAASVVGEAMTALVIADAVIEKFGGDSMEEVTGNFKAYLEYVKQF
ncbi:MAG: chorismate synthase [Nitrospirae bacterium]|nr:chorismate synthase [Nitrospirota bacterium]MCL5420980.1 chorismate synthase [Nitrospirota bacterium]